MISELRKFQTYGHPCFRRAPQLRGSTVCRSGLTTKLIDEELTNSVDGWPYIPYLCWWQMVSSACHSCQTTRKQMINHTCRTLTFDRLLYVSPSGNTHVDYHSLYPIVTLTPCDLYKAPATKIGESSLFFFQFYKHLEELLERKWKPP